MRLAEDSLLRDPIFKICIIGIPLCIIALYVTMHDDVARSINASKSLDQMASTSDCTVLKFMTMNHEDDWFPSNYIKIARERMNELKCK